MVLSLNLRRFLPQISIIRQYSSSFTRNQEISPILTNRNPRNLEKLRIGYKPDGYHVDRKGRNFWYKLKLSIARRHLTAAIVHFRDGEVLRASTKEWALQRQLYGPTDHAAYVNLARVLARRCLESGVTAFHCDLRPSDEQGKLAAFVQTLRENGLDLEEREQFKPARPWDQFRPEKPWDVHE